MNKAVLLRYGVATLLPLLAAYLIRIRPSLGETPHFIFLSAIVLSALYGGVGPAFYATSLCTVLVQILFVHPFTSLGLLAFSERFECMGLFLLVSLMIGCLVSALRRERNHLRDSEERYRILAETASDAILVIDERGEILFVNPVAEQIFETKAPHLLGQNVGQFLPNSIYQPQLAARELMTTKAVAFHLPAKEAPDTNRLLEMTLSAFSKQGKRLYTAIIRDITRHNRAALPAQVSVAAG